MDKPQLTVGQLIDILIKEDLTLPVMLEGCDCGGEAVGLIRQGNPPYILITRNP